MEQLKDKLPLSKPVQRRGGGGGRVQREPGHGGYRVQEGKGHEGTVAEVCVDADRTERQTGMISYGRISHRMLNVIYRDIGFLLRSTRRTS